MVSRVVTETEEVLSLVDALRVSVQTERRCVIDEREAFDAFRDRVESINTTDPDQTYDGPQSLQLEHTPGLDRVRNAYKNTVMSTSNYETEYNDTYKQSVVEEFGPEVGLLLTNGVCFDQQLKKAVLDNIHYSQKKRDELLQTLEIETESIDTVEGKVRPVLDELQGFAKKCSAGQDYGVLEAEWTRLDLLSEKTDKIAHNRQKAIKRQRKVLKLTSDQPDIPTYLYHDFENKYPLLSELVDIRSQIEIYRAERRQALCEL